MKSRKRLPQKQSSRMYLHNADHRDAIYNEMYHNAMWANTENIDDELVWVKYPNHALMTGAWGWMDADRQFNYCISNKTWSSNTATRIVRFEAGFIIRESHYSDTSWSMYLSEDGIVWKNITDGIQTSYFQSLFGTDGMCNVYAVASGGGYNIEWRVDAIRFIKDEETEEWSIERKYYVYDRNANPPFITFVCNDTDGCIVCKYSYTGSNPNFIWQEQYLKVNWDGTIEERAYIDAKGTSFPTSGMTYQQNQTLRFCKNNHKLAVAYWGVAYSINYMSLIIGTSSDDGNTWTYQALGHTAVDTQNDFYPIELFCRNGNFFLLAGSKYVEREGAWQPYEMCMWASFSGTDWSRVSLEDSAEINVLQAGGQGVVENPSIGETIVIAHNPSNVSTYNYRLYDLLHTISNQANYGEYNAMFSKGKVIDPSVEDDFWLTVGNGSVWVYYDNRHLEENTNCFAWVYKDYDSQADGADYLIQEDYCVPYDTPTPFDPYQYPFWDYYKWIGYYEKVPRVDLDLYPNWHVIVVEYLPITGANSVLYKVPRYNV